MGTLVAAASISAMADLGGGTPGFSRAYDVVAALMLAMLCATLALRKKTDTALQAA